MSARLDYHARELQRYRIQRELQRARERGAMIAADRRDAIIMTEAEYDRAAKCAPVDRCLMHMEALAIYDRYQASKKLRLMTEDERTMGRVWP